MKPVFYNCERCASTVTDFDNDVVPEVRLCEKCKALRDEHRASIKETIEENIEETIEETVPCVLCGKEVPKIDAWNQYCTDCLETLFVETAKEEGVDATVIHFSEAPKTTQTLIAEKCDELKELLLEKNRKYGDSAINPIRVFSKASAMEQLLVRMDDKLNRIRNRQNDEDEDVIKDLAGYLVLYMVAKDMDKKGE